LAVHFAAEESIEQRPNVFGRDRFAVRFSSQRSGEVSAFDIEVDVVRTFQPVGEMRNHVE